MFCFSAVNGKFLGSKSLGTYGSTDSEVESVTVRTATLVSGGDIHVHVLELDNDETWDWAGDTDDCYLHSYRVPEPDLL